MKALLTLSAFGLTLLSAPLAAQADTRCSDASGTIQYAHEGYNRGMPPRDGDVIGRIKIIIRGKLASESIAYKGKDADLGPINPDFSEVKVLREQSGRSGLTKDFAAKLTLSRNAKNPGPFDMTSEYYVVCQETFLAIP